MYSWQKLGRLIKWRMCEMYGVKEICMRKPEAKGKWGMTEPRWVDDDDDDDNSIQFLIH